MIQQPKLVCRVRYYRVGPPDDCVIAAHCDVWLFARESNGAEQVRLRGYMPTAAAEQLAASFSESGITVERETFRSQRRRIGGL